MSAVVFGLTFGQIETRAVPNEGIRRSARNALIFGLGSGLVVVLGAGTVGGLVGSLLSVLGLVGGLRFGTVVGLFLGSVIGLANWLQAGGAACFKHVVLRLGLIRDGSTPWNYVRFLDHAAERILLRKVGGGYVFLHRMLMDYFAARYVEPSIGGKKPTKPFSIEYEL
jgi:hypothetical protein